MGQEYTLKTNHNPSYVNKDMVIGAMIGSFFTPIAGTAVGAAIGSYIGKKNQERENADGKRVSEPSMWNRDTLIGGYIGNFIGGVVAAASFAAITGVTISAAAASAAAGAPIVAGAAIASVVAVAAVVGGTVAGGYLGSKAGEARQAREYETARQQNVIQDLEKNVSPEVAKAVEYAMANDKSKNWGKEISDEREKTAAQGQEIKR